MIKNRKQIFPCSAIRQAKLRFFWNLFFTQNDTRKLELPGNVAMTKPSPYTHNIVGYMERPEDQLRIYALGISSILPKDFLLGVIGSQEEGLKQIFSSASEHSSLIIEYVQRFGDFDGFFTKQNVAELTHAAGVDEELLQMQASASSQDVPHH